jgi:hypothetical protein
VEALIEARRVLQPGGRLAIQDTDYDGWAVASEDVRTTRAMLRALGDSISNPHAGLLYRSWLADAGFGDVSVEGFMYVEPRFEWCEPLLNVLVNTAVDAGVISADRGVSWLSEQRQRSQAGRFCMSAPLFIANAHSR